MGVSKDILGPVGGSRRKVRRDYGSEQPDTSCIRYMRMRSQGIDMSFEAPNDQAYAWIWLPRKTEPIVAGRVVKAGGQHVFEYAASYLKRHDAVPIYEPELPLRGGPAALLPGLTMPSCLRDASPDGWGRRVLAHGRSDVSEDTADGAKLGELTCLLEAGSDRIGALDFQLSSTEYRARESAEASLPELAQSIRRVERGIALDPVEDKALLRGVGVGGARPKVLLEQEGRAFIAKFSSPSDRFNVVKAEYIAMRLAAEVGLDVAPVQLCRAGGRDVLLVERFDRVRATDGWQRKAMVSALTLFELDEMFAAYASYETLADIVRQRFTEPKKTLKEMFGRIVFNILCGNTDDHARNHAAFWDGSSLSLTGAYDICPQARTGQEASQAMLISGSDRLSRITTCLDAAPRFRLGQEQAKSMIAQQIRVIREQFDKICDEAALEKPDRERMWGRQFLNPYAFYGSPEELAN